jgi:hypothetical protein
MKLLSLLLLVMIFCSCSQRGTETGNPHINNDSSFANSSATYQILKSTCEHLASCNVETSVKSCTESQSESIAYGAKLGLAPMQPPLTVTQIVFFEVNENLVADIPATETCMNEIKAISCADPRMTNAYNTTLENPYLQLSDLLTLSCQKVFP